VVEVVEDFCYLGSFLSSNSNCDKDCQKRIGKAASVFVLRMDDDRIPKQAISWEMSATSRGPGRPRKNWNGIIRQDLKSIGVSCEDADTSPSTEKHGMNLLPSVS